jgi:hypothetical protein
MSEAPDSAYNENYLIGILTEDDGDYSFRYKFNGKFPKEYLKIREFPDAGKIYTGQEVTRFISRILPPGNRPDINKFVKLAGLSEYDTWGMLKFYGLRVTDGSLCLYENLPEGATVLER